ncbi:hypothetical protein Q4599_02315 [Cellulophaga lytica]|uniref:hypothetical protein n=1 Tax=Cellulophaga lytica TaxID=979 RepID=UPI0026E1DA8A|nr:hypothetical protein [Cellulophaga lytica]MDO6852396.1 hypothetical protein [Cellulophaga lytica]
MMKKILAREFLILIGTTVLIGAAILFWSLLDRPKTEQNDDIIQEKGFRAELYQNMIHLKLQDEFKKFIDIEYQDNFVRLLEDPKISKSFYDKAKSLELYKWNHKYFPLDTLKKKYGDSLEEMIEKYQFRKTRVITDLSYAEFKIQIENDTLTSIRHEPNNSKNSSELILEMTSKGIARLVIGILLIVYPLRWIFYLTKWSLRQIKN